MKVGFDENEKEFRPNNFMALNAYVTEIKEMAFVDHLWLKQMEDMLNSMKVNKES